MRDLIWTVILIWLAFRIVSAFQSMSKRKQPVSVKSDQDNPKDKVKSAVDKHLSSEGEYVDFEEIP